jgi:hypothetical protein
MATPDHEKAPTENDVDADTLLASLEEEDDTSYRAQRLQELQSEHEAFRPRGTMGQDTPWTTLKDDDEALRFTTEHERSVVHFFHPDFARCAIMDQHCQHISTKHTEYGNADVAFGRIDVKNAPFVVEKLNIRVLPCVIGFVKGIAKGRITGFEGVCWDGKENSKTVTLALEEKFVEWTVLRKKLLADVDDMDTDDENPEKVNGSSRGILGRKQQVEDEDDDWD